MAKAPKGGGWLRDARVERDAPADTRSAEYHRGMCIGHLRSTLESFREFLTETQHKGTRIHKDDARQMKYLVLEFETEMLALFNGMRVQQDGVRDKAVDVPTRTDTSNVVSLMIRRGAAEGASHE
jgi:hypothetical protein